MSGRRLPGAGLGTGLPVQVPAEVGLELVVTLCPCHRQELEDLLEGEAYDELDDGLEPDDSGRPAAA
jgi:hypothetical protein